MKVNYYYTKILIVLILIVLGIPLHTVHAVNIGDPFPLFTQVNTLSENECRYLGIDCKSDFAVADLKHDAIIVEFLNVYCHTCRMQVPIFNDLYTAIQADPELSGKVCIVGIAVGNDQEEVREFKQEFGALYPILTDPEKVIFNQTGNIQGTPHTYILRKEDRRFIIDYHAGGVSSKDRYLSTIRFALRGSFEGAEPGNKARPFSFSSNGTAYTNTDFAGKNAIFYFPVDETYPLAIDTRNTANQAAVLKEIAAKYPDLSLVMVPYDGMDVQQADLPASMLTASRVAPDTAQQYRRPDRPTIYYINSFGRISFKGDAITLWNAQGIIEGREYKPVPDIKEDALIALIEEHIAATGKKVLGTEKVVMENREAVFVTTLSPKREGLFLFSRLESDPSLCDICHDSHFMYTMNGEGVVLDFIPVQLTKLGNIAWSDADVAKIKKTICGTTIFRSFPFDPKVDAVTSATMTSSLIFESFNEAKEIFADYTDYKFRNAHWRDVCFATMAALSEKVKKLKENDADVTVDQTLLLKLLGELQLKSCPHHGMYLPLDGNILCSIHGMYVQ